MQIALFVPCYVDQLYPGVAMATARHLERHGATVEVPEEQTCCGQPMANSGLVADARPLADKLVRVFSPYEYVVCPSGSCTAMVRNHYHGLVRDTAALASLASKTFELCEFLHDVLKVTPTGSFAHKVGLHDSCHGLRELRLGSGSERNVPRTSKVRTLLAGLDGIELVPLAREDDCCGFGGAFSVDEEAVSCAMGNDRIRDHRSAGATVITGTDISCLMHMDGLMRREASAPPLRVMHVAELLEEASR